MSSSQLDQLKAHTRIVADTSDFETMKEYAPQDATTNPSLILAASKKPEYQYLIDQAVKEQQDAGLSGPALVERTTDRILILFGKEILDKLKFELVNTSFTEVKEEKKLEPIGEPDIDLDKLSEEL